MSNSLDRSKYTGYQTKLWEAASKKSTVDTRVYGTGDYGRTDVSQTPSVATGYFAYLRSQYPLVCAPTNPQLFPDLFPTGTPECANQTNIFNVFVAKQREAALLVNHVTRVRDYWEAKKSFLGSIKSALYYWKDWNITIHDFLDTGLVAKNRTSMISLAYDGEKNIRATDLESYFTMLGNQQLYGPGCKVRAAQTAENMKETYSNKAKRAITNILETCAENRTNARATIEALKIELADIDGVIADANSTITHLNRV